MPRPPPPPTLLCGVNFPANTGFAWDYIEHVYARLADHLREHGVRTLVGYPSIPAPPRPLEGSAAVPVELDTAMASAPGVLALADFVRRENVRVLYLCDRSAIHWGYALLRRAGLRRVVVHDHSSGTRVAPTGVKRAAKWLAARVPPISSDAVLAVSDFVADRQVRVGLVPRERVLRVYNAVRLPEPNALRGAAALRALLAAPPERPVVACACRCTPEKGVAHLLRAFDRVARASPPDRARPLLVYLGDGPAFADLQRLRDALSSREDIVLAGYRPDAAALLEGADLCVVPSTWAEAFGLAVVEPMARGKPVIATRVGGIPELIDDGATGLLVPPGDEAALAAALAGLLADPERARRIGEEARRRVAREFTLERKLAQLLPVLEAGFEARCAGPGAPAPPRE